MVLSPLTPSDRADLPSGCRPLGGSSSQVSLRRQLKIWRQPALKADLLLVLGGTRTAEWPGISAAGSTPVARRLTALADAELLLRGPGVQRHWPLPELPAGVSPALLSRVVVETLGLAPVVVALGLPRAPDFAHLRIESAFEGPSSCLSGGCAMSAERVQRLWRQGQRFGARLRAPLVLAECVPGGTTTAQAVLTGLGMSVAELVSGSALQPPQALKSRLVREGLDRAGLMGESAQPSAVLAAVGDPFQALAAGLLVGAATSRQPVLIGGGSQMVAVLALALMALRKEQRQQLSEQVMIGTTAWLADEAGAPQAASMFSRLVDVASDHCGVALQAMACGVRLGVSRHQQLRDYELGYVKEGVGAGALLLLAQLQGLSVAELVDRCDQAMDALHGKTVGSAS